MTFRTVCVFGASGRQGQAQILELIRQGCWPRAVSRNRALFNGEKFEGTAIVSADYADPASLDRACRNADAIFFQPPQFERPDRILDFARNLAASAVRANVGRFVLNSTMWAPDTPCGQPMYDQALRIENIFAATGLPLVVFRPTVFMDNWLTAFAKPALVRERVYRYPHKPTLRFAPICLDDVAKFMVAALQHDLTGERIRIAGPEALTPPEVTNILSDAMGTAIRYEYQTPREFGEYVAGLVGLGPGSERDAFVAAFDAFYTFNNDAPEQPFLHDVAPLLKRVPLQLERFREWARRQDWTTLDDAVGSVSR